MASQRLLGDTAASAVAQAWCAAIRSSMLPFPHGLQLDDYFQTGSMVGRHCKPRVRRFRRLLLCVNWFLKGPDGKFRLAGYGGTCAFSSG